MKIGGVRRNIKVKSKAEKLFNRFGFKKVSFPNNSLLIYAKEFSKKAGYITRKEFTFDLIQETWHAETTTRDIDSRNIGSITRKRTFINVNENKAIIQQLKELGWYECIG